MEKWKILGILVIGIAFCMGIVWSSFSNRIFIEECLPEGLPELMTLEDGTSVTTVEQWKKRRTEILKILSEEEYGYLPPVFSPANGKIIRTEQKCCSGHATLEEIEISAKTERGEYTFPLTLVLPKNHEGKTPVFLLLQFRPGPYDMYIPTEEIIDHGFGLAIVYYEDIVPDDDYGKGISYEDEWETGLSSCFLRPSNGTGFGRISLWAWGASRVMDYLLSREDVDGNHIAVIGHSRLGKTALWCAANDERFFCAIANDSGCAGAALERGHHEGAETLNDVIRFDSWFCENFRKYVGNIEYMPFDQHFLIAAIAPRLVAVGSANEDTWADPINEQLSCIAASPSWKIYGKRGYIGTIKPAKPGDVYNEGGISYHLRDGIHFLSRSDWLVYMDFLKRNISW